MEIHVRRVAMKHGQMSIHRKLSVINPKRPDLFLITQDDPETEG